MISRPASHSGDLRIKPRPVEWLSCLLIVVDSSVHTRTQTSVKRPKQAINTNIVQYLKEVTNTDLVEYLKQATNTNLVEYLKQAKHKPKPRRVPEAGQTQTS